MDAKRIDFYFDPMCPWAYQTSVWIREVRRLTGLEISWKFFSLEEINLVEGKKHPWERDLAYGWSPMRVGAWLRRQNMTWCDAWYEAMRLWEMTVAYSSFEGLYEIKTPKTKADLTKIGEIFAPYLTARQWNTVQNPAP